MLVPKRVAVVAGVRVDPARSAMFYATFLLPEALAYPVVRRRRVPLRPLARRRRPPVDDRRDRRLPRRAPQVRGELATARRARTRSRRSSSSSRARRAARLRAGWSVARPRRRGDPRRSARSSSSTSVVSAQLARSTRSSRRRGSTACGASACRRAPRSRSGSASCPRWPGSLRCGCRRAATTPPGARSPRSPPPRSSRVCAYTGDQGRVPLDRLRDARRGAQHDLPRAAPDRRAALCTSRRAASGCPGSSSRPAFVTWLVTAYGYQLDYPYFEAPGLRHRRDGEPLVALGPADDPHVDLRRLRGVLRRRRPARGIPRVAGARVAGGCGGRRAGRGRLGAHRRDHERARLERVGGRSSSRICRSRSTGSTSRPAGSR